MVGIQQPKNFYKPVEGYENAMLRNESLVNASLQPMYTPDQIRAFKEQGSEEWMLDRIQQDALQQTTISAYQVAMRKPLISCL